jgi:pimeloyl-ACP methyl ester carboxylesterase
MRRLAMLVCLVLTTTLLSAPQSVAAGGPPERCGKATLTTANPASGTKGTPVPHGDGAYTPVLMVHGWNGTPDMWWQPINRTTLGGQKVSATRSLAGSLAQLRGAAVYTLDYHDVAGRWFADDGAGGQVFLDAARCLVADKVFAGHKMVVVAHSMGGLITRWAVNTDPKLRAGTSLVLTLSTPYIGSWLATVGATLMEAGQVASRLDRRLAVLRDAVHLMLLGCQANGNAPGCSELKAFLGKLSTVRAFSAGSREYTALKPWPAGIAVRTLAARNVVENVASVLFSGAPVPGDLDLGDGVVDVGSATNGPALEIAECRYTASAWKADTDGLLAKFGFKANADKREFFPLPQMLFSGTDTTCGHNGESKLIQLTNPILGEVGDQLSREEPLSEKGLYNAPVPRLCEHPAGTLKDGTLPGIPANDGYVQLLARVEGPANHLILGDLTGDGTTDAAAVFRCSQGGVNWPAVLVLYGPGPKILGSVDLGDLTPAEHAEVQSMTLKNGDVFLQWQSYEGASFCIRHWAGHVHWNGTKPTMLDMKETAPPEQTTSSDGPTC